jgi:hypothetical protein
MIAIPDPSGACAPVHERRGAPETNRRRGAPETNRRRGAPRGNRNALKTGCYTAEAKARRRRKRLLLRQLRAGLAYMRAVIRARNAAAKLARFPSPPLSAEKIFKNRKTIPAGQPAPRLSPMHGYCRIPESGDSPLRRAAGVHGATYSHLPVAPMPRMRL